MGSFSHIRFAARTDVGRKRTNNEDSLGVWPRAGLFCVADGMGGLDDGEVASSAIVGGLDGIAKAILPCEGKSAPFKTVLDSVSKSIDSVSAWIYDRAVDRHLSGCGSTFVGICFDAINPSAAMAMHVGDSRLYRIRAGKIEQITKDHSAAELIGAKDEREINPMFRGMIFRAVGMNRSVELEMTPVEVMENDSFILCSDGLYRMLNERRIAELVDEGKDEDTVVCSLVDEANDAGGEDNVSVVLLKIGSLPPPLAIDASRAVPKADAAHSTPFDASVSKTAPVTNPFKLVRSLCNWIRNRMR